MNHPVWLRVGVLAVATLFLVAAMGLRFIDDIAEDNLSSADFVRDEPWHPREAGLDWVWLNMTVDGDRLAGYVIPGTSDTTVVLVHGHAGTKADAAERWAPMLHAAGHTVAAFDLPNHGQSDAIGPVTFGMLEADAVLLYALTAGAWPDNGGKTVLMGGSMGAATVLHAAAMSAPPAAPEQPYIAGVISDSAYETFVAQGHRDGHDAGYPRFLVDWVIERMDHYASQPVTHVRPVDWVREIDVPVMLAHCTDDTRVAFDAFPVLEAAATEAGNLRATWTGECPVGLSDFNHVDGWTQPGYNQTVLHFITGL